MSDRTHLHGQWTCAYLNTVYQHVRAAQLTLTYVYCPLLSDLAPLQGAVLTVSAPLLIMVPGGTLCMGTQCVARACSPPTVSHALGGTCKAPFLWQG
eukprot:4810667-Prymnesium_polylepis.1